MVHNRWRKILCSFRKWRVQLLKVFELHDAIEIGERNAITLSAIGKKEFSLSEGELAQIKQETADTLIRLWAVTQKINSFFDFLPIGDSRTYISPLSTASVFLQSGEGILNFLYADFDLIYSECLKHTRKTCPTRQVLIFSYWPKKKKVLLFDLNWNTKTL